MTSESGPPSQVPVGFCREQNKYGKKKKTPNPAVKLAHVILQVFPRSSLQKWLWTLIFRTISEVKRVALERARETLRLRLQSCVYIHERN